MKNILLFFVFIVSCAYASTERFVIPDLSFIPRGVYNVFPGAPNRNGKFSTIQSAINQALLDGFTPNTNPFQTATIMIFPSDEPYSGDPINNEIIVPASIILKGATATGTAIIEPQIFATVIFNNRNVPFGNLPFLVPDFKLAHGSINFIQPSPGKPAIIIDIDPTSQFFYWIFDAFEIANVYANSIAPAVEIRGGGGSFVGFFRGFLYSNSKNAALVHSFNGTSVFFNYANVIAYRLVKFFDTGQMNPISGGLFVYMNDINVPPPFLGFETDSPIKLIEMEGVSVTDIRIYSNDISTTAGIEFYTSGQILFDAPSASGFTTIQFLNNMYSFIPVASGPNLLYNAPNLTIVSGNTVDPTGVTSFNAANIIPESRI